jgi:hypothetical protein
MSFERTVRLGLYSPSEWVNHIGAGNEGDFFVDVFLCGFFSPPISLSGQAPVSWQAATEVKY